MVAYVEEQASGVGMPPRLSREDYLLWEGLQEARHEYHDGLVIKMSGASFPHTIINANINRWLGNQLDDTDCIAVPSDLRVYVPQCNRYFYPDTVVVCDKPYLEVIQRVQTLFNPALVVEVLSKFTEKTNRGDKFDCYKTLASLQTYVLIAQTTPRIEVYERQATGEWRLTVTEGLEATAKLERIGCELVLKNIYNRVNFDEAAEE